MAITILETLQNAQHNLGPMGFSGARQIGMSQLNNAIALLEKDYPVNTVIDPILEKYGDGASAPEFTPAATQ